MRLIFAVLLAAGLAGAMMRCAVAAPPTSLDLHADRVAYYSNRYVIAGEGHVRIRLSDGTHLSGEFFQMDLKLNRYILAGNVHIDSGNVHEVGAGFAGYPDLDRSYFLTASGSPDRWTYFGLDFAHPHKGHEEPGDAFFIPDVEGHAYVVAGAAQILPRNMIKFEGSRIYVLGAYIPTGQWVELFSANPNYNQNAFAGATFDIGLPFNGSLHAVSALHLRYTGMNKEFLSFDQHFVWGRDYIVFSINPLTNEERQFNLIGYKRISPKMEFRAFLQESSAQHGVYQPEVASAYENLQYVYSARHSSILVVVDNYNTALLQYPTNSPEDNQIAYDHPSDAQLSWLGRDTRIGQLPIAFRLRSGYGFAHDGYHCGNPKYLSACPDNGFVLDYFGQTRTPVTTIYQHFVGLTLYTNSIALDGIKRSLNLNVNFDKQRQWFSLPHHEDTTTTTISLSKLYTRKIALVAAYNVTELGDYYGARQLEFYQPYAPSVNNGGGEVSYPGYAAFRGFSTTRAWTGSAVFTPNQNFNYAVTLRRGYDFPAPIPGVFGNAPWQLTNEVRFRIGRHILLDATRTDYFNWGGFTPLYTVVFGP